MNQGLVRVSLLRFQGQCLVSCFTTTDALSTITTAALLSRALRNNPIRQSLDLAEQAYASLISYNLLLSLVQATKSNLLTNFHLRQALKILSHDIRNNDSSV